MTKHTFQDWANRTGCYVLWDIKSKFNYVYLSKNKPKVTISGMICDETEEIGELCQYPSITDEKYYFVTPEQIGLKKYPLSDWMDWLNIPIKVEIERHHSETNIEYYVYYNNTQTCITEFIKDEIKNYK